MRPSRGQGATNHERTAMRRLMLSTLACLALVACKHEASAADPLAAFGEGIEWQVTEINGTPVPEGVVVTMALREAGLIGGSGGCNRYNGRITVVDGGLHLGELAGTRMMCPPAQMQVEQDFHSTLPRARLSQVSGGVLELTDARGKVLIRATP